jgi:hypothetical protein
MAITGRRPTLTDCGCEATVYADGSGIELHYCPMHQAAKEMLEALREVTQCLVAITVPGEYEADISRARAAIAKAGG